MRVFLAGATGVLGIRALPMLRQQGHVIACMTRSPDKTSMLSSLGEQVLAIGGVIVRYGRLYGPGTYYETEPPPHPRIHVGEAAQATLPLLDLRSAVVTIADPQ
jgi:hypothetical protein